MGGVDGFFLKVKHGVGCFSFSVIVLVVIVEA